MIYFDFYAVLVTIQKRLIRKGDFMFSFIATAETTSSTGENLTDQAVSQLNAFQRFLE